MKKIYGYLPPERPKYQILLFFTYLEAFFFRVFFSWLAPKPVPRSIESKQRSRRKKIRRSKHHLQCIPLYCFSETVQCSEPTYCARISISFQRPVVIRGRMEFYDRIIYNLYQLEICKLFCVIIGTLATVAILFLTFLILHYIRDFKC